MFTELVFFFFMFIIMAVTNPIFVHNGETILFFMNDNPVTLEALIYGAMASLMIVGVMLWCRCYSDILTTDKFFIFIRKSNTQAWTDPVHGFSVHSAVQISNS